MSLRRPVGLVAIFAMVASLLALLPVSTANAGAVEVEVDGENQGRLGRSGQGATREFPVQPAG